MGHDVLHFAYPFGKLEEASAREYKMAGDVGFKSAVTACYGHIHKKHKNHLHALPRIPIDYNDTVDDLKWKLSGMPAMVTNKGRKTNILRD